ncbi:MAG: hypothetical protein GX817_02455 [Elusimicrobia bacterium]|nr:hypothetical protein [Elusimicrobiota bacterium]
MLSVIFGIVSVVAGVLWLAMGGAWGHFLVVLQGSVPPFLILVGLVAFAAGVSSIKDNAAARKEEAKLEAEAAAASDADDKKDDSEKDEKEDKKED